MIIILLKMVKYVKKQQQASHAWTNAEDILGSKDSDELNSAVSEVEKI